MRARFTLLIALIVALAGCAPSGRLEFAPPAPSGTLHDIWVANFRATDPPRDGQRSPPRPKNITYERLVVSVPQTHQPGQIEWPRSVPDAATDFVTTSARSFQSGAAFADQLARSETAGEDEVIVFVHGYNVTHGEAVYQLAQVKHDFEISTPTVLFSWPSVAVAAGYLYDRDSVLISRDQLEQTILELAQKRGRKIVLMGHSMGAFLIMETLRQIEISGSLDIGDKIGGVFLFSADIDDELFQSQASRIDTLPNPFVIMVARQDRALRVSALLSGRSSRLGSQTELRAVGDLPVTVVDVSALSTGGLQHTIALTSPTAIAIFKRLRKQNLPADLNLGPLVTISELAMR